MTCPYCETPELLLYHDASDYQSVMSGKKVFKGWYLTERILEDIFVMIRELIKYNAYYTITIERYYPPKKKKKGSKV